LVERLDRLFVYGDQIIEAEEGIQLLRIQLLVHFEIESVKDDVEVIVPVIEPRHVRLAEGVVNGQRMEVKEIAELDAEVLLRLRTETHAHPGGAGLVLQGPTDLLRRQTLPELAGGGAAHGADHRDCLTAFT